MTARLRPLAVAEWPAWAGFVHQHNQRADGRVRCLHAEQGSSVAAHAAELAALPPAEAAFVVAEAADGAPLGWIGAEHDTVAGRAWLRGPLTADPVDADGLQQALIDALLQALPALRRCDAFPQTDEVALIAAYRAAGFAAVAAHHVMRADAVPEGVPAAGITAWPADATAMPALQALHDRLFPNTYLPGHALPASLDADHQLFVATLAGQLAGYVYVQHRHADNEGYVDYLGVANAARGQGLGRALLTRALHWALVTRGLPHVHLTVRQDSAPALDLYRAAGFVEVAAGLQLSLQR